ncbi:uncharacterized protein LOC135161347 [Diachasmimorpha longicaudata]|uniref:uncharacterized protein LOC135161347 n=1 Tax=Diachasmimorpha longicaudata TaxID=58733 RepID=UPI0030B8948D
MADPAVLDNFDNLTVEELRCKLQVLGLSTKGAKAVLLERLRRVGSQRDVPQDDDVEEEDEYEDDLESLSVGELKSRLRELQLRVTGKKAALIERIRSAGSTDKIMEGETSRTKEGDVLDQLRTKELKSRLQGLGLETTGKKADLLARVKGPLIKSVEADSDSSDSDSTSDSDDEDEVHNGGRQRRVYRQRGPVMNSDVSRYPRSMLTFKDVEEALERFSGDGSQNIWRWFCTFEETAEMCSWSEAHKVIYMKKLLDGPAKLFANYECHAKEWWKLKKRLIKEFSNTVNSKQVHEQLSSVRKKADETYEAYVYRVLEMASHGDIELDAKLQYIIDGIQDDETNKLILYGATTVKELRKKMKQYETQKKNAKAKVSGQSTQRSDKTDRMKKPNQVRDSGNNKAHCFNCGSATHYSDSCPDKAKGPRCFNCNEFGHVSTQCPRDKKHFRSQAGREAREEKPRCDALSADDKKTYKEVKILGKEVTAVLDSGSDLHLVRSSCYVRMGAPHLDQKTILFDGVGALNRRTLGRFKADVVIDGLKFRFDFDVVPDNFLGRDILIGAELSDYAEVRVRYRQAVLKKIDSEEDLVKTDDSGRNEELNLSVCEDNNSDIVASFSIPKTIKQVQSVVDSSISWSTQKTPFEVLIDEKMKLADDQQLRPLVEEEFFKLLGEKRTPIQQEARENLPKLQEENRKIFNRRRKPAKRYAVGDLVAVRRRQFRRGLKLYPKFFGPYKIVTVMKDNCYLVEKFGDHEGPNRTSAAADCMKPWAKTFGKYDEWFSDDEVDLGGDIHPV